MAQTAPLYLEDLAVGQTFRSGTVTVDPERVKAFASEFDPQPFHLDDQAAGASVFGGLVASGWHTAALTMRLLVESELRIAGGLIGVGVEGMQWPRPVWPGDTLQVESEVLEVRPSGSRPDRGVVRVRSTTRNQDGKPVMVQVASLIVPPAAGVTTYVLFVGDDRPARSCCLSPHSWLAALPRAIQV